MSKTPQEAPLDEVQRCWEESKLAYEAVHRIMERERRFSDGEHYLDDTTDLNPARLRPKTESLTRVITFKVGKILSGPLYFETKPTEPADDPDADQDVEVCDDARWLIEQNVSNPCNRYGLLRHRMAWAGYSMRMGVAALNWHHNVGARGEALYTIRHPSQVMWTPGWVDPHDPTCPWLVDVDYVPLVDIKQKKGWRNVDDIKADDGTKPYTQSGDPSVPAGLVRLPFGGYSGAGMQTRYPAATIVKLWKRYDEFTLKREKGFDVLDPQDRYMACGNINADGTVSMGCGWQSPRQSEESPNAPPYPPRMDNACPTCGGNVTRVDGSAHGSQVSQYAMGRLIITAPYSNVVAYGDRPKDRWPFPFRSFPFWFFQPNPMPMVAIGPSETTRKWSLQAMDDASLRLGYEQMNRNRDVTLVPRIGLEDASGNPFDWTSSDGLAFYTADAPLGPRSVQHFQGSGLSPAYVAWRTSIRQSFREDEGTNDFSPTMGEGGPKDIPVGTMGIYAESGNVPLDLQKKVWEAEESMALALMLDMMTWAYDEDIMQDLAGSAGMGKLQRLRARAVHVSVVSQPSLSNLDEQTLKNILTVSQMPPYLQKIAARRLELPPADLREMQQGQQAMQQQMQQSQPPGKPGVVPPPPMGGNAAPTPVGGTGA